MPLQLPKKAQFVFIINERYLPNPHLVELGRRWSPRLEDVMYLEPNVLFCPQTMSPLLLEVKNKSSNIKEPHRKIIYEEYTLFLKNNQDLVTESTSFWRTVGISAIIEYEIKSKLQSNGQRETRSLSLLKKKLKTVCLEIRDKRMANELHLNIHISEDISRSLAELNYAIKQFGLSTTSYV